jgi:recombinational DNA repair protein (RecF pathway)
MIEHYTEAIVLDKEDLGEHDSRVFLYSKDLGKIVAKITSARKIISKLASHLEPGNLAQIRLINKNSFQVADALKDRSLYKRWRELSILHLVKELVGEGQPDEELWNFLIGGELNGEKALAILGFDGQFASCGSCGVKSPTHFLLADLDYSCLPCFVKSGRPANFALK